nr:SulP family inorganic anion transporter [Bacillus cereus]
MNQIETIGTTYGNTPHHLPNFQMPVFTLDKILMLLPSACIIAALGGIESLLSAMVADNMANRQHNSNKELMKPFIWRNSCDRCHCSDCNEH